jgi:hypothetical protein
LEDRRITEVGLPPLAEPGDLMFAGFYGGDRMPDGTWWRVVGSGEPWQRVGGDYDGPVYVGEEQDEPERVDEECSDDEGR